MLFEVGKWRQLAAPIIQATLRDLFAWNPQATIKDARAALREVYPFEPRRHHPYKMWCKQVRIELARRFGKFAVAGEQEPLQGTLFEESAD